MCQMSFSLVHLIAKSVRTRSFVDDMVLFWICVCVSSDLLIFLTEISFTQIFRTMKYLMCLLRLFLMCSKALHKEGRIYNSKYLVNPKFISVQNWDLFYDCLASGCLPISTDRWPPTVTAVAAPGKINI